MLCDGYREERVMGMLDHVGIGVADYQRSKEFYEKALAPLGYSLLMEFSGAAAGFGKDDGGRPSFFLEAHGAPGIRWYHDDYYGGYVLDPDGNNVEAVCHKPA